MCSLIGRDKITPEQGVQRIKLVGIDQVVPGFAPGSAQLQVTDHAAGSAFLPEIFFRNPVGNRYAREKSPTGIGCKFARSLIPPYEFSDILAAKGIVDPAEVVQPPVCSRIGAIRILCPGIAEIQFSRKAAGEISPLGRKPVRVVLDRLHTGQKI